MRIALAIIVAILTLGLDHGPVVGQAHGGDVRAFESIHMVDVLAGWAVTAQPGAKVLLRTTDGGTHWKDVAPLNSSGQRIDVDRVDVLTSLMAWAMLWSGLFRTVDGGQTWRNVEIPATGPFHFINPHYGWLVSLGGANMARAELDIYRSTDGGETWIKVASTRYGAAENTSGLLYTGRGLDITFLNATTGWVTGTMDMRDWLYLYVTHDSGHTWRKQELPRPSQVTSPWLYGMMRPKFFTMRDGILPVFYAHKDSTYSAQIGGVAVFFVTHDGGAIWTYTTPLSVAHWGPSSFADFNHGWVAEGDTLYVTSDGGRKWTTIRPAPTFGDFRQLDFISPQVGWAVSQMPPFLLKTLDGGHTWTPVTYTVSR